MTKLLKNFWNDESGQGVPEYGMILGGVIVVAVAVATFFQEDIVALYTTVKGKLSEGSAAIETTPTI